MESDNQVFVILGPGVGHYHPISTLAFALTEKGYQVKMLADVLPDSQLAEKVKQDGFEFVSLNVTTSRRSIWRIISRAWLYGLDFLLNKAAAMPSNDDLPAYLARVIFGIRSYTKPFSGTSVLRLSRLQSFIKANVPRLILADEVASNGLGYICASEDVRWIKYTTSPANVQSNQRPVYPVGHKPDLPAAIYWVNRFFLFLYRAREAWVRARLRKYFSKELESRDYFVPLFHGCFSIRAIDDYAEKAQNEIRYLGSSLYRFEDTEDGVENDRGTAPRGIYISFGSTGTAKDRKIISWLIPRLIRYRLPLFVQVIDPQIQLELKNLIRPQDRRQIQFFGRMRGPAYSVYEKSCVVIGHGGYNTVIESLFFKCPILLIPNIAADRMEVARRVVENNLGRCLNYYNLDADQLHEAMTSLLNDSALATQVAAVSELLRDSALKNSFIYDTIRLLEEN